MKNNFLGIGVVLAAYIILAVVFNQLFWKPNEHTFTYTGDGSYIMHNMTFHTKYGYGTQLQTMNYPHGEVIFLTDAQGAISVITSWISRYWVDLSPYMVGLNNVLLLYTIPLCALLLYFCLRELKVDYFIAFVAALLITFLSPQINRMTCGHFGIGYTFLIPLVFYYLLRQLNNRPWKWGSFIVPITLIFFGFNNPYILLISASPIIVTAGYLFLVNLKEKPRNWSKSLSVFLVAIIPLVIVLGAIKSLDHVEDRVKAPSGYSYNYSMFEGVFLPQETKMSDYLHQVIDYSDAPWEGRAYVGLLGLLVLAFLLGNWLFNLIRSKGKKWYAWTNSAPLNYLLWVSLPILIFAMNFFQYGELREIKFIPFIQQFRAPGRFAWIFYYSFSLAIAYCLHEFFQFLKTKKLKTIGYLMITIAFAFWSLDAYLFLKKTTQGLPYDNHLSVSFQQRYAPMLADLGVDRDTYQAMYVLPATHMWTDKLVYDINYFSEYHAFPISLTTGIPYFNAWLSRMSVSQTLNAAQIVSHPLIQKTYQSVLQDKKPILIVHGIESELSEGEEYLVALSDTLVSMPEYTLFRYNPYNEFQDTMWQNVQTNYAQVKMARDSLVYYDSFDDEKSDFTFYGPGARHLISDERSILNFSLPTNLDRSLTYECSIWVYVDHRHGGMPFINFAEDEAPGELVKVHSKWASRSKDIQDGWLRVAAEIKFDDKTTAVRVESFYDFSAIVDEFQMRAIEDTSVIELPNTQDFLYNNFKIKKTTHD